MFPRINATIMTIAKKQNNCIIACGFNACNRTFSAPIKNIEILGLNTVSRGAVLSYLPVEVGDDYNAKTSSKIIRILYKTHFFKDIEVTTESQILKIKVTENPHIKHVTFLNNSEKVFDENTIKQILISMEHKPTGLTNFE
jgi:outer membrane protein insertion porin family